MSISDDHESRRNIYLRDVSPEMLSRLEELRAATQGDHPHRIVKRPEIAREALARGIDAMLDDRRRVHGARKRKETSE